MNICKQITYLRVCNSCSIFAVADQKVYPIYNSLGSTKNELLSSRDWWQFFSQYRSQIIYTYTYVSPSTL